MQRQPLAARIVERRQFRAFSGAADRGTAASVDVGLRRAPAATGPSSRSTRRRLASARRSASARAKASATSRRRRRSASAAAATSAAATVGVGAGVDRPPCRAVAQTNRPPPPNATTTTAAAVATSASRPRRLRRGPARRRRLRPVVRVARFAPGGDLGHVRRPVVGVRRQHRRQQRAQRDVDVGEIGNALRASR